MTGDAMAILTLRNLQKYFPVERGVFSRSTGWIKAVDGIDLSVHRGETLGLVGESGCGKSTLGKLITRLEDATGGEIEFEGRDTPSLKGAALRELRREIQTIFQDPYSSLNPRMTAYDIIEEPLLVHGTASKAERRIRVFELLETVGIRREFGGRYPHEFSGGQRQRIGIARALALNPKLVVCDEPVSALDVSIQAQIINLLENLQKEFGLTYIFISHDLSVVEHISDRIAIMYLGQIVELAESSAFYAQAYHPYSEALLSASPVPDPTAARQRIILKGDPPSPIDVPAGCRFHMRCPYAAEICRADPTPPLEELTPGRWVRCWRAAEIRGLDGQEANRPSSKDSHQNDSP